LPRSRQNRTALDVTARKMMIAAVQVRALNKSRSEQRVIAARRVPSRLEVREVMPR